MIDALLRILVSIAQLIFYAIALCVAAISLVIAAVLIVRCAGLVKAVYLDLRDRFTSQPERSCRICGCTEDRACPGGCYWADVEKTICSNCVGAHRRPGDRLGVYL